jgi:hypothetical protein
MEDSNCRILIYNASTYVRKGNERNNLSIIPNMRSMCASQQMLTNNEVAIHVVMWVIVALQYICNRFMRNRMSY